MPVLVKAAVKFTYGREEEDMADLAKPMHLDYKYVDTPDLALGKAREEIVRMGHVAEKMYDEVTEVLFTRKMESLSRWRDREDALDRLQREVTEYLVQVQQGTITGAQSREIASLMRMVNNYERVGDAVENLAELIEEMIENKLRLAEAGMNDYREIRDKVAIFLDLVTRAAAEHDREVMDVARGLEDSVDQMREEMRDAYLSRLRAGVCTVDPGLIFVDMLTNFEKIGDYCFNIAQAVAGLR
jgi:phosphate:Na+ symporter